MIGFPYHRNLKLNSRNKNPVFWGMFLGTVRPQALGESPKPGFPRSIPMPKKAKALGLGFEGFGGLGVYRG